MIGHKQVEEAEKETEGAKRPFIVTYTGRVVHFDRITSECIDIRDIAHSLAHLCRYTGHTKMFYSVAQHSLLVSEKIPSGPATKLVGLLHDAAEAYTNDLSSPLKRWMSQEGCGHNVYAHLQSSLTAMIYDKFGVTSIPPDVRLYDNAAGVFEAEGFMGLSQHELEDYGFPIHLQGLWQPWAPIKFAAEESDAEFGAIEAAFLKRFEDLMGRLGRSH